MDKLLLRITEAAELTGIGRSKAYELVQTGEWPAVRIGRSVRVPAAWLAGWVERLATEAAEAIGDGAR
ncbi:MAG: excisionase family DNA-binding protein [Ardenticatenales bacterium]|nr:excisionase family DNA-binding protein [Ardenticatenales bacterium]